MGEIFNTTRQYINSKRYTNTIRAEAAAVKARVTQALWFLAKWFYNLVAREARAQCVNRVWVLASCKLAALIFTCIYPMVSAMTSYSSLTSRRIFVSRQHWKKRKIVRLKRFPTPQVQSVSFFNFVYLSLFCICSVIIPCLNFLSCYF